MKSRHYFPPISSSNDLQQMLCRYIRSCEDGIYLHALHMHCMLLRSLAVRDHVTTFDLCIWDYLLRNLDIAFRRLIGFL